MNHDDLDRYIASTYAASIVDILDVGYR
jgi:hypothetical protein